MADFNAFSIGIGADITVLQVELQRAKNLLAQFESASKKALTVGELNYSNSQIANLKNSIAQLNQEIGKTGRPIGDASQSLINFSRIAQDAPYGIMGIANNLNPMIESFQRLAATEGGTKKALGAMLSGLAGPAGIGVAIGVVSSLAVTFSKEISNFFKGPTDELKKFRDELAKVAADINKIIGAEQTKRTKGIFLAEIIAGGPPEQQQEALNNLKKLYSESADIKDAKLGEDKKYYENLVNLAAIQNSAVANEKNYTEQLNLLYEKQIVNDKNRNAELKKVTGTKVDAFLRVFTVDEQIADINKYYNKLGDAYKKDINTLERLTKVELNKITLTPSIDNTSKGKVVNTLGDFAKAEKVELQEILDYRKAFADKMKAIGLTPIIEDTLSEKIAKDKERAEGIAKLLAPIKERMDSPTGLGGRLAVDASKRAIEYKNDDEEKKRKIKDIKETQKAYEDFANSIANNVTGAIMGMWDALQSGESVLDALGNMLGRLAEQLVAAALQAAIFAGIMSLITGGVAGGAGGLSFAGYFMKAFGMAEGGIVTGPTHALIGEGNESEAVMPLSKLTGMLNTTFNAGAMNGSAAGGGNGQFVLRGQDLVLALQRSNSALTLRR
jgi:hypothetical protein